MNKDLKSQRSIHFILGGDYTFRAVDRNFKVTAEMYYKKLDNLNPYTVDNVKIRYYGENCAKGYAMGLDVKFFGEFVPGTDSWISFSLMKAQQTIRETTTVPMANSQGYNIRWGIAPDKLYNSWLLYGKNELLLKSLSTDQPYYFTIEAFNENGVSEATKIQEAQ